MLTLGRTTGGWPVRSSSCYRSSDRILAHDDSLFDRRCGIPVVPGDAFVGSELAVPVKIDLVGGENVGGLWNTLQLDYLHSDPPAVAVACEAGHRFAFA